MHDVRGLNVCKGDWRGAFLFQGHVIESLHLKTMFYPLYADIPDPTYRGVRHFHDINSYLAYDEHESDSYISAALAAARAGQTVFSVFLGGADFLAAPLCRSLVYP